MLNIALPKGRLGEKVYAMFERAGFECPAIHEENRKLFSFELKEELLEPLSLASERYVAYMTQKDYPTLQFYKAML